MASYIPYLSDIESPARESLDMLPGFTLLEFGAEWCGHCRAAQPLVAQAIAQQPQWKHLKIEDGSGKALGRSYRVKLWPKLVILRDGQEVGRLVRPTSLEDVLSFLSA
jgi:thioredoxin 1